jgi:hypothetical protein
MADRWSNPSGSRGIERFRVWPSGSDSYDHAELAANWDKLDAIIGVPAGGAWPATEGVGGGIYGAVQMAKAKAIPVGSIFPWIKAAEDAEVPDGYEICDGREVEDHEFLNVPGPVTLPDMRNRTVLGATLTAEDLYGGDPTDGAGVNNFAGSPAVGGLGGRNAVTLTVDNLAAHRHTGSTTGWSAQMETWYDSNGGKYPQAGNFEVQLSGDGNSIGTGRGGYLSGQHRHKLDGLAQDGGGRPHDNRPLWTGLVWIMKVRNPS